MRVLDQEEFMRLISVLALSSLILGGVSCSTESRSENTTKMSRCPVCGMSVEEYPNFLCQLQLKDGSLLSFDGPKDMFTYYQNPGKYHPSAQPSDIVSVKVSDYYSLERIDGRAAYYVTGSNVSGPMGNELIAFEKEDDAQEFMVDHAGKSLLRFKDVTPRTIEELNQ